MPTEIRLRVKPAMTGVEDLFALLIMVVVTNLGGLPQALPLKLGVVVMSAQCTKLQLQKKGSRDLSLAGFGAGPQGFALDFAFDLKSVGGWKVAKELRINEAWCKGCGICPAYCPPKVLEIRQEKVVLVNPEKCTKCALCELRCPDFAIYVEEVSG